MKIKNTMKNGHDHSYRIIIISGPGSGKTNALLNLIKEQDYHDVIDKIYLYARDLSEPKYQILIKKHEDAGIRMQIIQMHLLCVQIQWMMFMKILIIKTQKEATQKKTKNF